MRTFDFSQNIRGTGVIVRASLNVPIKNGEVTNAYRIEAALPTIEALSKQGARTVVIAHVGRNPHATLEPVFKELKKRTSVPMQFIKEITGEKVVRQVESLKNGEVLVLENIRRNPGETKNDADFAETLASYGSVYINDAFPVSHRAHASIVGIPKHIPGFAGITFAKEFEGISPALEPKSPNIAIIGGAKFETKEPLIRTLLDQYDHIVIGGALANDFFHAKGYEVGKSLVSRSSRVSDLLTNSKIIVPTDVVVQSIDGKEVKKAEDVTPTDAIWDIGPESLTALEAHIEKARFVLWNGPLGNFEEGFSEGTERLAEMIAHASGESVVGGGDTVASIQKLGLNNKFSHVSTAGGAMLDFIADGTLPGIEALN